MDGHQADRPAERGKLLEQALEDARTRFIESLSHYTLADLVEDALGKRAPVADVVADLARRDGSNAG